MATFAERDPIPVLVQEFLANEPAIGYVNARVANLMGSSSPDVLKLEVEQFTAADTDKLYEAYEKRRNKNTPIARELKSELERRLEIMLHKGFDTFEWRDVLSAVEIAAAIDNKDLVKVIRNWTAQRGMLMATLQTSSPAGATLHDDAMWHSARGYFARSKQHGYFENEGELPFLSMIRHSGGEETADFCQFLRQQTYDVVESAVKYGFFHEGYEYLRGLWDTPEAQTLDPHASAYATLRVVGLHGKRYSSRRICEAVGVFEQLHAQEPPENERILRLRRALVEYLLRSYPVQDLFCPEPYQKVSLAKLEEYSDVIQPSIRIKTFDAALSTIRFLGDATSEQLRRLWQLYARFDIFPTFLHDIDFTTLSRDEQQDYFHKLLRAESRLHADPAIVRRIKDIDSRGRQNLMNTYPHSSDPIHRLFGASVCVAEQFTHEYRSTPPMFEDVVLNLTDSPIIKLFRDNLVGNHHRAELWEVLCRKNRHLRQGPRLTNKNKRAAAMSLTSISEHELEDKSSTWNRYKSTLSLHDSLSLARKFSADGRVDSAIRCYKDTLKRYRSDRPSIRCEIRGWAERLLSEQPMAAWRLCELPENCLPFRRVELADQVLAGIGRLLPEAGGYSEYKYKHEISVSVHALRKRSLITDTRVLGFIEQHRGALSDYVVLEMLEDACSKECKVLRGDILLARGDLMDAKKQYVAAGLSAGERSRRIRTFKRKLVMENLSKNDLEGFKAVQDAAARGNVDFAEDILVTGLSGGNYSEAVRKLNYSGEFNTSFVVKVQRSNPAQKAISELEGRILAALNSAPFIVVPKRFKVREMDDSAGRSYIVAAYTLIPGVDIDNLPLGELCFSDIADKIFDVQRTIRAVAREKELAMLKDRYDLPGWMSYGQKINDLLESANLLAGSLPLHGVDELLNRPGYRRCRTMVFDANPANIKKVDGGKLGFFDFNCIRRSYPQDDWTRFIDHPRFIPDSKRDEVIDEFIESRRSYPGRLSVSSERKLFHAMAVYRNLCLVGQKQNATPADRIWHAGRAVLSSEKLGLSELTSSLHSFASTLPRD